MAMPKVSPAWVDAMTDNPTATGGCEAVTDAPDQITYNPVYQATYEGADPTRGHVYTRLQREAPTSDVEQEAEALFWAARSATMAAEMGDEVSAAIATIATFLANRDAAAKPGEWQSIDSAPKDATLIDVWAGGRRWSNAYWGRRDHFSNAPWGKCAWQGCGSAAPTHWMPQPRAPLP